jgi:hypothetical protein
MDAKRRDEEARRYVILRLLTKIFLDVLYCHRVTTILFFVYIFFPQESEWFSGVKSRA